MFLNSFVARWIDAVDAAIVPLGGPSYRAAHPDPLPHISVAMRERVAPFQPVVGAVETPIDLPAGWWRSPSDSDSDDGDDADPLISVRHVRVVFGDKTHFIDVRV